MKRKIFAVISAVFLLTGCGASQTAKEPEFKLPTKYEPYEIVKVEPSFEEGKNSEWYKDFCNQLLAYSKEPIVEEKVSRDDFKSAFRQINTDYPDIFWFKAMNFDSGSKHTAFELSYMEGCDENNIKSMHEELEKAADELIRLIPTDKSDYEKILFVHDYIAQNTVYDASIDYETGSGLCYTAYGCLVQKKAVCQGYAEAFTYIMNRIGIESGVCQGDTYAGGHAWNYVKLDGEYYWLDITWDDTDNEPFPVSHNYFLFDDEIMSRTRKAEWEQNFVPECTADKYNWFSVNNALFDSYDFELINKLVEENSGKNAVEMMFTDFYSYTAALQGLIIDKGLGKIPGVKATSSYYHDDRNYSFTIIF
ncbi:MAG: hypothetical protein IKS03_03140 [Ruminococcus sp.]|nr:hypothetical protein [Ruminococcus sp.]